MPLINCKVELSLNCIENCILNLNPNAVNNINEATFTITDVKLYVPIVTLSSEDNANLSKLLSEGFKRPIYWNGYKVIPNKIVNIANNDREYHLRELLDSSYQGVKRLFVLAYNNSVGDMVKFLLILSKNIFFRELK